MQGTARNVVDDIKALFYGRIDLEVVCSNFTLGYNVWTISSAGCRNALHQRNWAILVKSKYYVSCHFMWDDQLSTDQEENYISCAQNNLG